MLKHGSDKLAVIQVHTREVDKSHKFQKLSFVNNASLQEILVCITDKNVSVKVNRKTAKYQNRPE